MSVNVRMILEKEEVQLNFGLDVRSRVNYLVYQLYLGTYQQFSLLVPFLYETKYPVETLDRVQEKP